MVRRFLLLTPLLCFVPAAIMQGQGGIEIPDAPVFVSTGPTSKLLAIDTDGDPPGSGAFIAAEFSTRGGFRPEGIAFGADGKIYVCDPSNSEIYRINADFSGGLEKIYDRDTTTMVDPPEQPTACEVRGLNLIFIARRGRGGSGRSGIYAIEGVVGSPLGGQVPVLKVALDSLGGVGGEGLAVGPDGTLYFTFGAGVRTADFDLGAHAPFGPLGSDGFGVAVNGFGEVLAAARFQGAVEVFDSDGSGCGFFSLNPDLPWFMEFDAGNNLWLTTSQQSSGRRGAVYFVAAPKDGSGAPIPFCGLGGGPTTDLTATLSPTSVLSLDAAVGITLGPTGSEPQPLVFEPDATKSNNVNLCGTLFNIDLSACVDPVTDTWLVSCRIVPQPEFESRTSCSVPPAQQDFSFTACGDHPSAAGNCLEVRVDAAEGHDACLNEILGNWQFFAINTFATPGLLYAPGDDGDPTDDCFVENILTAFDPAPDPSNPADPRMTGSRSDWGSGLIAVDGAPNRPPVASAFIDDGTDLVDEITVQCSVPVELDGSLSGDLDFMQSVTSWTWSEDGSPIASGQTATVSGFGIGTHTVSLTVSDGSLDSTPGNAFWQDVLSPLPSDEVTITVVDNDAPTWSGDPTFADGSTSKTLWPPNHEMVPFEVLMAVNDNCGGTCRIVEITSDDPVLGTGDGDTAPDWELLDGGGNWFDPEVFGYGTAAVDCASAGASTTQCSQQFRVRRERSENDTANPDRTYTIYMECTDGNATTVRKSVTVLVDDNQGGDP